MQALCVYIGIAALLAVLVAKQAVAAEAVYWVMLGLGYAGVAALAVYVCLSKRGR